jgi:hypothetical protein
MSGVFKFKNPFNLRLMLLSCVCGGWGCGGGTTGSFVVFAAPPAGPPRLPISWVSISAAEFCSLVGNSKLLDHAIGQVGVGLCYLMLPLLESSSSHGSTNSSCDRL